MAFKVICFWKRFAGLSFWSNNYNDSTQQALLRFIQSREAMRADHSVTKQNVLLRFFFSTCLSFVNKQALK